MAPCRYCNLEMLETLSCVVTPLIINRRAFPPVAWGDEIRFGQQARTPCRDCRTPPGGIHHHGCAVEECPACRGQAICCDCTPGPDCGYAPDRARCTVHR